MFLFIFLMLLDACAEDTMPQGDCLAQRRSWLGERPAEPANASAEGTFPASNCVHAVTVSSHGQQA
jgi:hypothetical protein